jgi:hypothetical protein
VFVRPLHLIRKGKGLSAMPQSITKVRIFVASSSDVKPERQHLIEVVNELNKTIAPEKNLILEAVLWETHCHPQMGRIQGVVNEQIGDYDIFVGIMWRRFGTPTGVAESGTEEEFRLAYSNWEKYNRPHILFYFCNAPFSPTTNEEAKQNTRVKQFKEELLTKGLVWEYVNSGEFPNIVRPHLALLLGKLFPRPIVAQSDHVLIHQIWPFLEPKLQDALLLAFGQCQRENSNRISTRKFFAALRKLNPEPLNKLLDTLPSGSLPEPTGADIISYEQLYNSDVKLSGCVAESMRQIGEHSSPQRRISPEDMFVDIAKHGTGSSVTQLRQYGINAAKVDAAIKELGWQLIERD